MKETPSWIAHSVDYQINLRALAFREPRNVFDALDETPKVDTVFQYLTENLPKLKELGVTILHVMPPFLMGMANRKGIGSNYAIRDYTQIDPEYGTLDQFKAFVKKAHELDFKVILGMVPNHTSRDNVWMQSNPDYFVQDEQGTIIYDLDWTDTAKLDYTKPGLRKAMRDIYDLWLGCLGRNEQDEIEGVDGFRVDMAHFINDRSFWDETLPRLKEKYAHKELLFLAECYGFEDSLDMFRRGFNACYDDAFYKLLEHYYGTSPEGESHLFTPALHPERTRHSPHYETFRKAGYAGVVRELLDRYEAVVPEMPHPVYLARYTDNHDEGRGIYRFGPEATKVMMELACFSNHCIPFLLCGQEFGAFNRPSIHNRFGLCGKGREILAGDAIHGNEGIEWEGNCFIRTAEARRELFQFYRQLLQLRASTPALQTGSFRFVDPMPDTSPENNTVLAFIRELDGKEWRAMVNLGGEPRTIADPGWLNGRILYGCRRKPDRIEPFSSLLVLAE